MNRLSVLCLLFLGLFAMANAENLRTLSLSKGVAQIPRNLAVQETTPTTPSVTSLFASSSVATDLGMDYLWARNENYTTLPTNETRMVIMISLNETIFTQSGSYFTTYTCDHNCSKVENSSETLPLPIQLPFIYIKDATRLNYTFNQSTSAAIIVNGSWDLKAQPLLIEDYSQPNSSYDLNSDQFPTTSYYSPFGMIGFGTEGDAGQNFQTPNPIFSFHLNASQSTGDLIFGFDDTRITSYTPAYVLKTDANWKMNLSSIQYGDYTYNDTMTLVFDVSVEQLHLPWKAHDDIRTAWNDQFGSKMYSCDPGYYYRQCYFNSNNLTMIPNITFTLADGTQFSIDAYHFFSGSGNNDTVDEDPTQTKSWTEEIGYISTNYSTNGSNSSYVVLGQRAMSQFYSLFQKTDTDGNTITLYNPVPQIQDANYTAPSKDNGNGNGNGNNGNTTTPGDGTGSGDGSGSDNSGDDAWITYLTYAGVAAVVIIFIVVIACCCCKSEPKPVAKKTLTVELRGADKSTESSVASSVRL